MQLVELLTDAGADLSAEVARRGALRVAPLFLASREVSLQIKESLLDWLDTSKRIASEVEEAETRDTLAAMARAATGSLRFRSATEMEALAEVMKITTALDLAIQAEQVALSPALDESDHKRAAESVRELRTFLGGLVADPRSDLTAHLTFDVRDVSEGLTVEELRAAPLWHVKTPKWYLDAQEEAERVMEEQRLGSDMNESTEWHRDKQEQALKAESATESAEAKPISLYFNLADTDEDEIAEIISELGDLYRDLGGDQLVIQRMTFLPAREMAGVQ